jgi:hypothetical protein
MGSKICFSACPTKGATKDYFDSSHTAASPLVLMLYYHNFMPGIKRVLPLVQAIKHRRELNQDFILFISLSIKDLNEECVCHSTHYKCFALLARRSLHAFTIMIICLLRICSYYLRSIGR